METICKLLLCFNIYTISRVKHGKKTLFLGFETKFKVFFLNPLTFCSLDFNKLLKNELNFQRKKINIFFLYHLHLMNFYDSNI